MASSFAIFEFFDAPDEGVGEAMTPRTANLHRMDLLRNRQMGNAVTKGLAIAKSPSLRSKTAPEPPRASNVLRYAPRKPSIAEIKAGTLPKNSDQSPPMKPPKLISRPWRRTKTRRRAKTVPAPPSDLVARMQALPNDQLQEILQKRVKLPSLLQTISRAGRNLRHRSNHIKVRTKKASNNAIKNAVASGLDFVKKDPELMLYELEAMKSLMLRQQYVSGLRAFIPGVARAEAEADALELMSPAWEKKIAMVPKIQRELVFLVKSLQAATVATIKAVKKWRAQLALHARETGDQFLADDSDAAIFKWHGENYLITSATDVLKCLRSAKQSGWLRLWFGVTQDEDWDCWNAVLRCTDNEKLLPKARRQCTSTIDDILRVVTLQQEEAVEALKEAERVEAERLAMSALLMDSDDEDAVAGDGTGAGQLPIILTQAQITQMARAFRRAIGPLEALFDPLLPREHQDVLQCQSYLQAEARLQARVDAANAREAQAIHRLNTADREARLDRAHIRVRGVQAEAARALLRTRQEQGIAKRRLRQNGAVVPQANHKRLRPRLAAHKHTFAALVPVSVGGQRQTVMVRRRRQILVRKPVRPSKRTQERSAVRIQTQFRRFAAENAYQRQVDSAISVQKTFRGYNARTSLQAERDSTFLTQEVASELPRQASAPAALAQVETDFTGAATIVQSAYRGHRSRDEARVLREREAAASRIQAVSRGHNARVKTEQIRKHNSTILRGRARNRHNRQQKKQHQAAARIQGLYRIREAKQTVKVEKAGAVIVGAAKQRLDKVNNAAVTIQTQVRRQQATQVTEHKREVAIQRKLEADKATQIQSAFRGQQARKLTAERKLEARVANLSERQQSWLKGSGPASPVENIPTKATRKSTKKTEKKTERAAPKPKVLRVTVSKGSDSTRRKASAQPVARGVLHVREATLDL